MMRVATIDIGTNTVLLLVAERAASGSLRAVAERATITRLGEGVDRTRTLSSSAIARTRECLKDYANIIRGLGFDRVLVVGTSAMRDAGGGDEVRDDVRKLLGVDARVLSGEDEARLTFRGAVSGLPFMAAGTRVAVFDLGGGSTEVVIGNIGSTVSRVMFVASCDVGSVRLTERHVTRDPPSEAELNALTREACSAFVGVPPLPDASPPIGIAGTMTTLAAVSLRLAAYDASRVHGHTMRLVDLRRVVEELAVLDLEERKRVPGMDPARADVIVAGGRIALALLNHWKAPAVRISDRGVRWGLAEELMSEYDAHSSDSNETEPNRGCDGRSQKS
ncbi:MAG: Ppx/GppA family phosphatase [Myxococcota bacterium]|nr:Ppx/GppA family phosphatase [Myxococcota bacterium]